MHSRPYSSPDTPTDSPPNAATSGDARPDLETLRRFKQFEELSEAALTRIAKHAAIDKIAAGQCLAQIGTVSPTALYLLRGRLNIESANGVMRTIEGGTSDADYAVSFLQPHRYTVTADSPVTVLCVDREILQKHLQAESSSTYEVREIDTGAELRENMLFRELYEGCQRDSLELPSLPDIAVKIHKAMESRHTDVWSVALVIDSDPAIAAKLIRVANSALYGGNDPVNTTSAALVRLGWSTTKRLVTSFAMREMFHTESPALKKRMKKLWQQSVEIAAVCFVIAGKTHDFEPEIALLAGLLENVGAIAVITYAEKYPEIAASADELERVIETMHPHVGSMMLRAWGFPESVSVVPLESRDWYRAPASAPDYCCLVLFAHLLNRLMKDAAADVPPIHELPCLAGLGLGEITLESALELTDNTKDQIQKMHGLLSG